MTSPGGNVVEIRVTAKDETGPAFEAVQRKAKGLAQQVDGGSGSAGSAMDSASKKAVGFAGSLKRVAEVAAGVSLANLMEGAARRTMAFMQSTIASARDLGESVNAVSKVFDESTDQVIRWGKENANSFGLSQRAFNQAITPLGAMLKNTGMSMQEVADNTIKLTERAADMASVFNVEVPESLFAIQAALRGETEPIRRFGVSLSEVTIQQKALAMSGKASAAELTAQEKAAARLALIFEQTADTAGDFKDTSDGLANSQRIATARIEDAKAQIGTAFLPVMAKLAQVTGQVAQAFGGLSQPVQIAAAVIVALGAGAVIAVPRILAMKAALDAAAASGSKAAAGLSMATTAAARFLPWLVLIDIQRRGEATLKKVGEAAGEASEAQQELTQEVQQQVKEVQKLTGAWNELHGVQLAADEEMLQAKQAIDAVGESFDKNGDKIRGNSQAALENRIALETAALEAVEAAEKFMENGGSAEDAAKMMDRFRRDAVKATGATGNARAEVDKLSKSLFALPANKKVTVKVLVDAALDQIALVANKLSGLGFAHGGISGARIGGVHGGLRWVGEQGPELVRLPYGSTVYPTGQSQLMASQAGSGGGEVRVVVEDRTTGGIRARLIDERVKQGVPRSTLEAAYK